MPTVIALDVSLSMSRPVPMADCNEEYQRRHLAVHGINSLLDFMGINCKLEFTSLVLFSYLWEQLVPFTRDLDSIKSALTKVELFNKTCIETVLRAMNSLIVDEWSNVIPSQIILITDGNSGIGPGSLKQSLHNYNQHQSQDAEDQKFPLPFKFPGKLHILCISNPSDADLRNSLPMYQQLIDINGQGGEVFVPDGPLSLKTVQHMFQRLAEKYYAPYHGMLQCGNFKCMVQLHPPPEPQECLTKDFIKVQRTLSSCLEICGFLDIGDAASPPSVSRHLVLPLPTKPKTEQSSAAAAADEGSKDGKSQKKEEEDEEAPDDSRNPSFTVLLHGSLKVEGMVALTKVGEDWYGVLHSWADSKKKSNLMLSLFEPGLESVNWLGNFNNLSPISDFEEPPYGEDDSKTPFPIRPMDKRSYAQSCVVWIKPAGLQADLQKVLRHARKLPDKQQQFYKELNRIRRAALSFGFLELLEAMASMLERECTMLPGTAHPSAALQLTHAANSLRGENARDIAQVILPLQTNFSTDD